jgi:hypothetical protein
MPTSRLVIILSLENRKNLEIDSYGTSFPKFSPSIPRKTLRLRPFSLTLVIALALASEPFDFRLILF